MRLNEIKTGTNDRGVSPAVTVILLIVVSVILVGALLSFSMGLTGYLQKPPQAGISINQQFVDNGSGSNSYTVTIVASSLPSADSVIVNGPVTSSTLEEVGDHVTLTNLEKGDLIVVIAQKGNQKVVVRRYRVG